MIEVSGVSKAFGGAPALTDVTLSLPVGINVLIGPSGCGKSTLLRTINRMVEPDAGRIAIGGRDVRDGDATALRRGIGYVIQSAGLFPHWTVEANIGAVPRLLGWPRERIAARVRALTALVQLDPAVLPRPPHTLSGGQAQRVGIARALAAEPPVLLMDEPFSALDPVTRGKLQGDVRTIQAETGTTIVFVTHDIDEALGLGDTVTLLRAGRVVRHGTPDAVVRTPGDEWVAGFLGAARRPMRLLAAARVRDAMVPGVGEGDATIGPGETLEAALRAMLAARAGTLTVIEDGRALGVVRLADLPRAW